MIVPCQMILLLSLVPTNTGKSIAQTRFRCFSVSAICLALFDNLFSILFNQDASNSKAKAEGCLFHLHELVCGTAAWATECNNDWDHKSTLVTHALLFSLNPKALSVWFLKGNEKSQPCASQV